MTARIIHDVLYIVCDFEGLGSHEREPQDDVLLSTFNAALSNYTLFKCDNRFDRDIEEMFVRFQSGVEYLKGSPRCFKGKLLIIIKDVIDNAATQAADEFEKKIARLAKQAGKIIVISGGKKYEDSAFFIKQMYEGGYALITYPPLATKEFFSDLNDVIQPQIEGTQIDFKDEYDDSDEKTANNSTEFHVTTINKQSGKHFLDHHMKMLMAQMNIGDWGAFSSEGSLLRVQIIESCLSNAVSVGAIFRPDKIEMGVNFKVEEDQNLILLDQVEPTIITVKNEEIIKEFQNEEFKKYVDIEYEEIIDKFSANLKVEPILLQILNGIEDTGFFMEESLDFLWKQFKIGFNRTHENFMHFTKLFQLFLFMAYNRRKLRVYKYIRDNTTKYSKLKETEIDKLFESAKIQLSKIRDSLTLCKSNHCDQCLFPCLLSHD
eukprot:278371_1